jgi:uncharacterized lipoprotein YbaY
MKELSIADVPISGSVLAAKVSKPLGFQSPAQYSLIENSFQFQNKHQLAGSGRVRKRSQALYWDAGRPASYDVQ